MEAKTITGITNRPKLLFDLFIANEPDLGGVWYVHAGGTVVNFTRGIDFNDSIIDTDLVHDIDCFTWPEPITTEKELEIAVKF